jgi:hypothetical protein
MTISIPMVYKCATRMMMGVEHVPDIFDLTVNFNGWIRI